MLKAVCQAFFGTNLAPFSCVGGFLTNASGVISDLIAEKDIQRGPLRSIPFCFIQTTFVSFTNTKLKSQIFL